MTTADLITEARRVVLDHKAVASFRLIDQLADALEVSEARVARANQEIAYLNIRIEMDSGPNCSACRKDGPEGPHSRHDGRPCAYHDGTCEEAEADPALKCQCGRFVPMAGAAWPADLLEAVQHFAVIHQQGTGHPRSECEQARATLARYGLLKEPLRPREELA